MSYHGYWRVARQVRRELVEEMESSCCECGESVEWSWWEVVSLGRRGERRCVTTDSRESGREG